MRSATCIPVGQRRFERLHQQMAVEAEDLVEQFLAEAVHHRHDDDQRRHAEHDAEEGKAGDDRDEAFLAARPQIAQRQHPFERRERRACRSARSSMRSRPGDFTRFGRIQATALRAAIDRGVNSFMLPARASASARAQQLAGAVGAPLHSTLPSARPFGPDQDLPGHADQVGGREFRARPLVEVVVEHVDALGRESR